MPPAAENRQTRARCKPGWKILEAAGLSALESSLKSNNKIHIYYLWVEKKV